MAIKNMAARKLKNEIAFNFTLAKEALKETEEINWENHVQGYIKTFDILFPGMKERREKDKYRSECLKNRRYQRTRRRYVRI